jgi:hypothetical protein
VDVRATGGSLFGVEEAVDRREGQIGELEVAVLHMLADPRGQAAGEAHGDAVLGAADGREGHGDASVERVGELGEGPLIDAADRPTGRLSLQACGGVDHLVVQAFGQKKSEFLGGRGHWGASATGKG